MIRRIAKAVLEGLLGGETRVAAALQRARGQRVVLAYHNIVDAATPPVHGDRSLHLPLAKFREQLDALQSLGVPVLPADAPLEPSAAFSASVTFDDAYAGVCTHAVPELVRRGLPATIFVTPGLLASAAPWWDRLADPAIGAVPERYREQALWQLRGVGTAILEQASRERWTQSSIGAEHRIATEQELEAALRAAPQLRLGVHTWSHPNLAALDASTLRDELQRTLEWLRARFPAQSVAEVAYPYGHSNQQVAEVAAAVGLTAGWRVEGGVYRSGDAAFARPRLNVTPGLSVAGFRMRLVASAPAR